MNIYQYILKIDTTYTTLTIEPSGWDKVGPLWDRSVKYKGILRTYTVGLEFSIKSGGGGDLLLEYYNANGISGTDGGVTLIINKRNHLTDGFELEYSGLVNFQPDSFEYDVQRKLVVCDLIDSGKLQKWKSREAIEYNLRDLISNDGIAITPFSNMPRQLTYPKMDIFQAVETSGNVSRATPQTEQIGNVVSYNLWYDGTIINNEIGDDVIIVDPTDSYRIYNNTKENEITITDIYYDVDLSLNVRAFWINSGNYTLQTFIQLQAFDENDVNTATRNDLMNLATGTATGINRTLTFAETGTITDIEVPVNGYLELKIYVLLTAPFDVSTWSGTYIYGSDINAFNFTEQSPGAEDSQCDTFFVYEAFTRLIQLMTGERDTDKLLYSELFGGTDSEFLTYGSNGDGRYDSIISGLNARQFPDAPFNVSFEDLFLSSNGIRNIGVGFDNTNDRFFIEKASEFYQDEVMFDLGDVSDLVIRPIKDDYYANIKAGFAKAVEHEEVNGSYVFACPYEYSTFIPVVNTKDYTCKLYGDGLIVEFCRRKPYSANASEDTKYDEYMIYLDSDGSQIIQGGNIVDGNKNIQQSYNVAFSPRENLIRHAPFIKTTLWKDSINVRFVKSQKNVNYSYVNQNGDTVNEQDNLTGTDLVDDRYYNAEEAEFNKPVNTEIIQAMNENPHRVVQFSFDGVRYQGFVDRVQIGDYGKGAKWKVKLKDITSSGENIITETTEYIIISELGEEIITE